MIGAGGPLAELLTAIWLVVIILSLFLIPRSMRIRVAERLGLGIRPRPEESGLRASPKVRILISALMLLLVILMLAVARRWFRMS
jgi:hypothetical protein